MVIERAAPDPVAPHRPDLRRDLSGKLSARGAELSNVFERTPG
jgi:hypothetical protein